MKIDLKDRRYIAAMVTVVLLLLGSLWLLTRRSTQEKIANEPVIQVIPRHAPSGLSLYGYVIVIDPGHGGADPGAHATFQGKAVYEAPYVMDVAHRLVALIRSNGGIPLLTRRTPGASKGNDTPASNILPLTRNDVFRNGSPVVAGVTGMEQRIDVARFAMEKYPQHHVLWVSIHFDTESSKLKGVSVIIPSGSRPQVADTLLVSFGQVKRLRKRKKGLGWQIYMPIVQNGVARNLYILRNDKNPAREKVLVELGNFGDQGDVWRIRSPRVRQQYAEAILAGIEP